MTGATAGGAPVSVFVAPTGNGFMRDIAGWLVEASGSAGRAAELVDDRLPTPDGSINLVVAPHEFFELFDAPKADLQRAAAASVCVCTEQPDTPWFHLSVDACRRGLYTLDINPHGVDALRAVGVDAHRLRLGGVPSMDRSRPADSSRPIDVLFMGGLDDRRGAILADLASHLYRRTAELRLFRFDRPVTSTTPGMVFGNDKYELLASARVLLNLHRDRSMHLPPGASPPAYFEWARMLEAMANRCLVITEPSDGYEPLVAGEHFVEATADGMGDVLDDLLSDPARVELITSAAHRMVTEDLALDHTLGPCLEEIERTVLPRLAGHVSSSNPTKGLWRLGATKVQPPVRLGAFRPYLEIQHEAKRIALAENEALRNLDATACLLRHGTGQHISWAETPAYAGANPQVSVLVTLYNYADVVTETLDSIVASEDIDFEIIVVEDHATDRSRFVVRDFMDAHPDVPIVLFAKDANEGLAAARNSGFELARAEKVMVMDADNLIYPTCLRKLAAALDDHADADAVYAILEDFGDQRNIRSAVAWDVARLCAANYIDAQAMLRRSMWTRLRGYRADDEFVYGWEDWDLWLRLAREGGHALLIPQILGRYRVQRGSMIALTNLATDDAIASMRGRYPELPWPA